MATTTNFGWETPDDTDLVKDGAAAIRTALGGVDTSFVDLKGGTTGQILSKASNTDLDYEWITNDVGDITAVNAGTGITGGGTTGAVTITNDMATTITTNGDLIYGTGAGTYTRRGIGSTGQVLTVSGGVPTWASPTGGGKVLQVVSGTYSTQVQVTGTTYGDSGLSLSITPTSSTSKIYVIVNQTLRSNNSSATATGSAIRLLRGSTTIYDPNPGQYEICYWLTPGGTGGREAYDMKSISYLDSPATTSSTTYKIQMSGTSATDTATAQANSAISVITLMEIGA